jgi:hypothetical protein
MQACVVRKRFHTWETPAVGGGSTVCYVPFYPAYGTPTALFAFWNTGGYNLNTAGTSTTDVTFGASFMGPLDTAPGTTTPRSWYTSFADNVATSVANRSNSNARYIIYGSSLGTDTYLQITGLSFGSGFASFTLSAPTVKQPSHLDVVFVAFYGASVGIGTQNWAAVGTPVSIGNLAFSPDLILFGGSSSAINTRNSASDARFSFGAAWKSGAATTAQFSTACKLEFGITTQQIYQLNSNSGVFQSIAGTTGGQTIAQNNTTCDFITDTGFQITPAGTANWGYQYMALKSEKSSNDFWLGEYMAASATGNSFNSAGSSGFVPAVVFGSATAQTVYNAVTSTNITPITDTYCMFAGMCQDPPNMDGGGTISTTSGSLNVTGSGTTFSYLAEGMSIYQSDNTLVGIVSTVSSNTAITLTTTAPSTLSSVSYTYKQSGQYVIFWGQQDALNGNTNVHSGIADSFGVMYTNTGTPATSFVGNLNNPDTRNGYEINYSTVNANYRARGFVVTVNDNTIKRRNPT